MRVVIKTLSKKGVTHGISLNKGSIRFWKIPGVTLTLNCSLFALKAPCSVTKVCASVMALSMGNC